MLTNQQLRDHPACPFQGNCGTRRKAVERLFEKTIALASGKQLRDFACEREAREPYVGATAKRDRSTITAYIDGDSLYIGCSEKSCPKLEANGRYFLGKCTDEPAMTIPKSLARAAEKEIAAMAKER